MSRRDSSRSILAWGGALVVSLCSIAPLGVAGQLRAAQAGASDALDRRLVTGR
jgi:hypothetical protein